MNFLTSLVDLTHSPYKMVLVSIISLFTYLAFLILFKLFFPKKKLPYLLLLLGFSFLPLISIFREGTYESGDLTINIAKTMSFYKELNAGHLIPRWSADLNATYGYPNFIFAYPLPYYLASIYHFLGFSFLNSVKLVLITSHTASGLAMYLWLKKHVSKSSAFLGSIFYLFAPYHLVNLHFRVNIGEMLALTFLPLSLLFIDKVVETQRKVGYACGYLWKFFGGLSTAFLFLSHQAVSLLSFPLLFTYSIFVTKSKSLGKIFASTTPLILGLFFSAYYWLPVLVEGKYTHQMTEIQNILNFPQISELIFSKWRYGFLFQGPGGELSPLLGYGHWIVIFISLYLISVKKNFNKKLIFFLLLFSIYFFLILNISNPIWQMFPTLRKIQFPYRILSVLILITSTMAALAVDILKKRWIFYSLISLVIITSILNWGNRGNVPKIKDPQITRNLPLITSQGEGLGPAAPIWVPAEKMWQDEVPKSHLETIKGNVEILFEERKTTKHSYIVNVREPALVKENTYYFPGWKLLINGQENRIIYSNEDYPGIITFNLNQGINQIDLVFTDTKTRKYAALFSLSSLFLSGVYLLTAKK